MILNYWELPNGAGINVFPIRDSHTFGPPSTWRRWRAYYFTGLEYRMLICPFLSAADERLLQRPGVYLKTNLPLGGVVYFPNLPAEHNEHNFLDDLDWMVDSYLFKFHATSSASHNEAAPRYYVDYANGLPSHGPNIFDDARVIATREARNALDLLSHRYTAELINFIESNPNAIGVANYAETSLLEEVCTHKDLLMETFKYLDVVAKDNPRLLAESRLTCGWEHVQCSKKYNRVVLSFYLAAIKEPFPNSPGSCIGMFKNLYNVLEFLMEGEGEARLCTVLHDRVGTDRLKAILNNIKASAHPQSSLLQDLNYGQCLSPNRVLSPLSENDPDLANKIAKRLYDTRNAVLHSKKTFRGSPVENNVRPGQQESFRLETDLAIIRPIAEFIVEDLDPDE